MRTQIVWRSHIPGDYSRLSKTHSLCTNQWVVVIRERGVEYCYFCGRMQKPWMGRMT
jgi:hypothetical protein